MELIQPQVYKQAMVQKNELKKKNSSLLNVVLHGNELPVMLRTVPLAGTAVSTAVGFTASLGLT